MKIFTVLMLALTTMPGLAATFKNCPQNATGNPPKCKCTNNRDEYSEYMNTCAEWISIRGLDEDIGICQKSAGGTRYGHSKAVHHKGKCFVFGDDTISRDPIISLVREYNKNFSSYKKNPETLINSQIEFGTVQQLTNWKNSKQPSINALITGYEYFCKKNGANFKFESADDNGKAYYVCRGTKSTEKPVHQSTPAPTNTNVKNGSVNTGGTNYSDDGVTLKNYSNKNDFIPFDSDDSTGKKEFLHNLALQYNNDFNVYKNSNQILPTVRFTAPNNLQRAYTSGTVFKEIQDHYEILCNKYVETGDAATMSFSKQGNTFICNIKTCKTGTLKQNRCVQQTNTSAPQTQPKETTPTNTTTVESVNNVVKRINGATNVVVGSTIKYPNMEQYNAKDQLFIKDALNNWKNKCKIAIEKVNGSVRAESDYIDADYDSETNSLKCRIKKCRDSNAHIAPDGKSCIANEDKSQQSRSATPDKVSAPAAQTVAETPEPTVSVEEDLLESDESSANERPEHENIEKLKPDDAALTPAPVNAEDVAITGPAATIATESEAATVQQNQTADTPSEEITEQEQKEKSSPTQADCDEDNKILDNGVCRQRTAEEACDYEGGTWTGTTCKCPEGEEWKVQYEQCVAKSAEQTSEEETNVTSATIDSDKQCPTPHTVYDESTKTCKYKKQGPFPKSNCYVGSFYIYTNMSGQQKEDNENEFKEWQAACKNLAECKHAKEMTWKKQNTGNDYINYGCIPKTCLPDFPDKKESGCEEETNVTDDVEVILNAFKQKAKQLKKQECAKKCETQNNAG